MSVHVLNDARFYLGGYDLSADGNEVNVTQQQECKDFTAFTTTTRTYKPGLFAGNYTYRGFQQEGTGLVGATLNSDFASPGIPVLASAEGGNHGDRCVFFRALNNQYKPISGKIGEPFMFEISGQPDGGYPVAEGVILEDGKTVRTGSGSSPAYFNVGGTGATQRVYATWHVTGIVPFGSPTLQLVIESAAPGDAGFTAPTARFSVSGITAVSAFFATPIHGPITDVYWRLSWNTTSTGITVVAAIANA